MIPEDIKHVVFIIPMESVIAVGQITIKKLVVDPVIVVNTLRPMRITERYWKKRKQLMKLNEILLKSTKLA